jgi:small multidrug resistance family-3 protein
MIPLSITLATTTDLSLVTINSIILFFVAALVKIGGGYLVWKWLRERKGIIFGIIGYVLFIYDIIVTFQPANFGRAYAAYEESILSSVLWGLYVVKKKPDRLRSADR